jgi:hypothetical protein
LSEILPDFHIFNFVVHETLFALLIVPSFKDLHSNSSWQCFPHLKIELR